MNTLLVAVFFLLLCGLVYATPASENLLACVAEKVIEHCGGGEWSTDCVVRDGSASCTSWSSNFEAQHLVETLTALDQEREARNNMLFNDIEYLYLLCRKDSNFHRLGRINEVYKWDTEEISCEKGLTVNFSVFSFDVVSIAFVSIVVLGGGISIYLKRKKSIRTK